MITPEAISPSLPYAIPLRVFRTSSLPRPNPLSISTEIANRRTTAASGIPSIVIFATGSRFPAGKDQSFIQQHDAAAHICHCLRIFRPALCHYRSENKFRHVTMPKYCNGKTYSRRRVLPLFGQKTTDKPSSKFGICRLHGATSTISPSFFCCSDRGEITAREIKRKKHSGTGYFIYRM